MIETWTTIVAVAMVFVAGMAVNDADWSFMGTDDKLKLLAGLATPVAVFLPIFGRVWGWW